MIEETDISDLVVVTPRVFGDDRGAFCETYNQEALARHGIFTTFVQDNQSWSKEAGTVRGLHFQAPPSAQAKLVRVVSGEIWDVAVDIRTGSPTFGQHVGVTLSSENGRQLLVPAGFLHGFVTRTRDTVVAYKCSATYAPAAEGAVRFDDPDLGIDWGIDPSDAMLSVKDTAAGRFADLTSPFSWEGAS
ncbi:dTDP-4-dehydrorhamnose 3,5-epimerase [Loktanella sp. DJP18]|uniref:dTDP-4-dehydrorhamnose 3,5-epimerase n=1 Tax=Loktanella sp. DJP18 TaxID=3409788 RepID=UPI003BB49436